MTADTALLDRLLPARVGAGADADADARGWLAAHGLPNPREEAWRYTPLDEIVARLHEAGAAPALPVPLPSSDMSAVPGLAAATVPIESATVPIDPATLDGATLDELAGDVGGPRLVFVDGVFAPGLSRRDPLPPGLRCGDLVAVPSGRPPQAAWLPPPDELPRFDGFQALNRAAAGETAVVAVEAGAVVDRPIHVVHVAVGRQGPAVTHPRTLVKVAGGARVAVIETFAGLGGGRTLTNASTTITIGPGASVTHHRIQAEAPGAVHVGHTRVIQAAESRLRSVSVVLGGDIARHAVDVGLHGPDATAALDGLYLPTGRQRHDNLVTVDHAASGGTSTQRFRGVIDDAARGSFGGHVIVRPHTVATAAHQSNRNLVLSRTAQADTRPWLEILADDVRCTHGATVGRLDDDALFYLRSRGIARGEARAMLVGAFIAEIAGDITPPSLRAQVTAAIAERHACPPPTGGNP